MKASVRKYLLLAVPLALAVVGAVVLVPGLRYPYYYEYASSISAGRRLMKKVYGKPSPAAERTFSLCVEGSRGNWDRVSELTAQDSKTELGTYFHNLANAMKGCLADSLMYYYQPLDRALFIPVREGSDPFMVAQSSEVWYRLGALAMAERCAILGMTFSPSKTGSKFIERLSDINFIRGDSGAASKFAHILGRNQEWTPDKLEISRYLPEKDTLCSMNDVRAILRNLLDSNPDNRPAYDYLLCYDLLIKDIDSFIRDYDPVMPTSRLYEEAALIHLADKGLFSTENILKYHIQEATYRDFERYGAVYTSGEGRLERLKDEFPNSYWLYYHFARKNEKQN